jgi:hypothetical protein
MWKKKLSLDVTIDMNRMTTQKENKIKICVSFSFYRFAPTTSRMSYITKFLIFIL